MTLTSLEVVYIADRQISVRMGQSFWSRGPSLSSRFTANDFPSLRLGADAEHNYALVLQASIELTQVLHNVHDILYSSKERSMQMVRRGDYNRYLDDFRHSMSAWQDRWDDLETSPKLNCTLNIFKEYVRLYANAFSFQSLLSRAAHLNRLAGETAPATTLEPNGAVPLFPQGVMSTAEGAYVLEAVGAARKILTTATQTDPEAHIRYMPFRFYVYVSGYQDTGLLFHTRLANVDHRYTVYSAVFLYKAGTFGALLRTESTEITYLVQQFIRMLEEAAIGDCHIASRFASLLKRMWIPQKHSPSPGRAASYDTLNLMNGLSPQCETPRNIDLADGQVGHDHAFEMQVPGPAYMPTPDFDLFRPDFSSLESELVGLGVGAPYFSL